MKWEKVKLGDVCKSIADGDHQAPKKQESGVPFITISNIDSNNRIDFKNCLYVSEEYYDAINDKRKATKDDILYSVVGSFGVPVLIKENIKFAFQRHIAILRPDKAKIFPAFMYYCMLAREFYLQADSVAIGSAQRTITLGTLNNMQLTLPALPIQKRIASILSAYDDLIENNQKQIKLLEEAAQRLYKEWFVDLRFPGHEGVKIVDGVPEGWKKEKVSDMGRVVTGKTPNTENKQYYGGRIPFVKTPDMHNCVYPVTTESTLTKEGADRQKNNYIPENSIMVSCIGTNVGLVNISNELCQTNQQINSVILDNIKDVYYMFFSMKKLRELLNGVGSNGTTMTNVNKTKFSNIEILYPDDKLREKYFALVDPMFKKVKWLSCSNRLLREARDRLLAKLMSGEMEVQDTPSHFANAQCQPPFSGHEISLF